MQGQVHSSIDIHDHLSRHADAVDQDPVTRMHSDGQDDEQENLQCEVEKVREPPVSLTRQSDRMHGN